LLVKALEALAAAGELRVRGVPVGEAA
jgi:hypothetical protein